MWQHQDHVQTLPIVNSYQPVRHLTVFLEELYFNNLISYIGTAIAETCRSSANSVRSLTETPLSEVSYVRILSNLCRLYHILTKIAENSILDQYQASFVNLHAVLVINASGYVEHSPLRI